MSGHLPDRARFLLRQENLATVITKISPPERTALEGIIRPIVEHLAYSEEHKLFVLDRLPENVAIYLFPEEMDALSLIMMKIVDGPSV